MSAKTMVRLQYGLFLLALVAAILKVVFHLNVVLLPLVMLLLGVASYLVNQRHALYLFFGLLPLVNALPDLCGTGYPFNYLAPALFYLSGLVVGAMIRRDRIVVPQRFLKAYLLFVLVVAVSALFVFLRWSNITLPARAWLQNTPVEPFGNRVSFATIFPVISLFLYATAPFAFHFIRSLKLDLEKVFAAMGTGFMWALVVAVVQRTVDPDILAQEWWLEKMGQGNASFSDFNGFGLFAGVLLVYFVFRLLQGWNLRSLVLTLAALAGIFLSGSRTAFVFVLVALGVFLCSRSIRTRVKITVMAILLLLVGLAGGVLTQRLEQNILQAKRLFQVENKLQALDEVSNWRITMIGYSAKMVSQFPLAGVGTGNFLFALKTLTNNQARVVDLPLNHYLLILDENGVPGLIFFLIFLAGVVPLARGAPDRSFATLYITLLAFLLVNTYLWLPEVAVLFWVVIALSRPQNDLTESPRKAPQHRLARAGALGLLLVAVMANTMRFRALHPLTWVQSAGAQYDYGFWYEERNVQGKPFRWTRDGAGLYLGPNNQIKFHAVKLVCGAPLSHMSQNRQEVEVFWRGKPYQHLVFTRNAEQYIQIEDSNHAGGFLEIRVDPTFNLRQMGLSPESRTLGVKFFLLPAQASTLSEVAVLNPR